MSMLLCSLNKLCSQKLLRSFAKKHEGCVCEHKVSRGKAKLLRENAKIFFSSRLIFLSLLGLCSISTHI